MKITIENTDKILELQGAAGRMPARVWEGETSDGIKVICFVTRFLVAEGQPDEVYKSFERELKGNAKGFVAGGEFLAPSLCLVAMPIYTPKAEKLVLWLRARKALSREAGVTIPQASIASPLINGALLAKATRKLGGASQHTIYWLTEHGVMMAAALKDKCRECGCSAYNPCVVACHWVEPGLCSTQRCIDADDRKARKKKGAAR